VRLLKLKSLAKNQGRQRCEVEFNSGVKKLINEVTLSKEEISCEIGVQMYGVSEGYNLLQCYVMSFG
jgi:hypothetical protein